MKDFTEFKELLNNGGWGEILEKVAEYAEKETEKNYSNDDGFSKSYAFNRYINEGTLIYTLEKYHEWLSQKEE